MKFVELSSEEFNKVSNNFSNSNFYQSYEWSKLKEQQDGNIIMLEY